MIFLVKGEIPMRLNICFENDQSVSDSGVGLPGQQAGDVYPVVFRVTRQSYVTKYVTRSLFICHSGASGEMLFQRSETQHF